MPMPWYTGGMELQPLPLVTEGLPGTGGAIKAEPPDFVVEEIPLYEPEGGGEHVYLLLRREGWTTRAVQQRLARLFGLDETAVGSAGLKDKQALTTQTFSLHLQGLDESEAARRVQEECSFEVLSARRHRNKLKTGHLLGNRFTIVVTGPVPDAVSRAEHVVASLKQHGQPNFYGPQRFGTGGENIEAGREVLLGRKRSKPWLRRFLLSAYQAHLFNTWLTERIALGWFNEILQGDIARKEGTGGLFDVQDLETESRRFADREISYTGPIYGRKMRRATGRPGELEEKVLSDAGITEDLLRKAKLNGARRQARLNLDEIQVRPHVRGFELRFGLPKGAYATTVLHEIMKVEPRLPEE